MKALSAKLGNTVQKIGFGLKKHSPEILVVAGVIGTVTSAVLACKATTKISGILDKAKEDISDVKECREDSELAEEYSEEDAKKDLTIIYVKAGLSIVKLYAPAVALGVLSLTSMLVSNNILRKRNLSLAAAYTVIDKSFKEYRGRVAERFGEEAEKEIKHNIKAVEIKETVTGEDGKQKTVKKTIKVAQSGSEYARFFDESSIAWSKNSDRNLMFVRAQQQIANDMLRAHGFLFLNEVYDLLGLEKTIAGQSVGWVYDSDNNVGDNYVDFGIYDVSKETSRRLNPEDWGEDRYERTILLDFNVDGPILERCGLEKI
jgi:hypothetical protein